MYVYEKLNDYVPDLRKYAFKAGVYEDLIIHPAQSQPGMARQLVERAANPQLVTSQRIEEMQKRMNP